MNGLIEPSNYLIRLYKVPQDGEASVQAALGDLFRGYDPADAMNDAAVYVPRDYDQIREAVRRLNAAGYETDEDS